MRHRPLVKKININIKIIDSADTRAWDAYVHAHPGADLYHLSGWKDIIEKTYSHKTCYLAACNGSSSSITGLLPLVHLKHFVFGNSLISIPFFDMGGILADNRETEAALLSKAIKLGQKLKCSSIELRQTQPLASLDAYLSDAGLSDSSLSHDVQSHKVRMLLDLPNSSEALMKSFKSKLRSQIKKPIKEGLAAKIGGAELINDFYQVFLINMRDLGSPVHSRKIIENVLRTYRQSARIVMVYKKKQPVAGSIMVGFRDTLENP